MKFKGKKILFLGSNVGVLDMLHYAQKHGAYTLVADYLPVERSEAKQYCDEPVLISTADTQNLIQLVEDKKIDGVLAGISEFNLKQAMSICRQCGLPFYCNEKQWDVIERKDLFRQLCIDNCVSVPKTYYVGSKPSSSVHYEFPLIVKPVDSSASIGITICEKESELDKAIDEALKSSQSGNVIIEEYFDGEEFAVHYSVADGRVSLVCMDNRYPVKLNQGNVTTIPIARVYPSLFLEEYKRQVNDNVIKLCESLNLSAGVIFFQGLYSRKLNQFRIFEAGLRPAGEVPCRIIESLSGTNYLHLLVDYSLLGEVNDYIEDEKTPEMFGKSCAIVSLASSGGKIGSIIGYEEVMKMGLHIVGSECRYRVGSEVPSGNTLRQIVCRFALACNSIQELADEIEIINKCVHVFNEEGKDMCVRFNPNILLQ